jgi:hypothetical protein
MWSILLRCYVWLEERCKEMLPCEERVVWLDGDGGQQDITWSYYAVVGYYHMRRALMPYGIALPASADRFDLLVHVRGRNYSRRIFERATAFDVIKTVRRGHDSHPKRSLLTLKLKVDGEAWDYSRIKTLSFHHEDDRLMSICRVYNMGLKVEDVLAERMLRMKRWKGDETQDVTVGMVCAV